MARPPPEALKTHKSERKSCVINALSTFASEMQKYLPHLTWLLCVNFSQTAGAGLLACY